MNDKRIKVAMICHFSNEMVRNRLHLKRFGLVNTVRRMTGRRAIAYEDFAPWVNNILYQSQNNVALEMYVVAPHLGLKKNIESFEQNGINYFFYHSHPSMICEYLDNLLFQGRFVTYRRNRKTVERIIRKIEPDIIILIGSENPDYSSTVLNIEGVPIFVLCQTVFNNPEHKEGYGEVTYRKRAMVERLLFKKTKYFGVYNDKHRILLKENGYDGYIFDFYWPNGAPFAAKPVAIKEYDFVNFANGMSWNKGYHDCIIALAKVKEIFPNVKLALVDKGPKEVKDELLSLIEKYELSSNVTFIPFFEKKTDLLQFLNSVRFAVLPCKVDHISGTMHQAMGQGLPTVVYRTTGTPLLNEKQQCVLIAEMNDVDDLAKKMLTLMEDNQLALSLSKNSKCYMTEYRKANESRMSQLIDYFKVIIDNYKNNTPITEN